MDRERIIYENQTNMSRSTLSNQGIACFAKIQILQMANLYNLAVEVQVLHCRKGNADFAP